MQKNAHINLSAKIVRISDHNKLEMNNNDKIPLITGLAIDNIICRKTFFNVAPSSSSRLSLFIDATKKTKKQKRQNRERIVLLLMKQSLSDGEGTARSSGLQPLWKAIIKTIIWHLFRATTS